MGYGIWKLAPRASPASSIFHLPSMSRPETLQQSLPGLWRILIHFSPQVRKHRLLIAGSLTALFAEIGLRLLEPWPLKFVFDHVIGTRHAAPSRSPELLASLDPIALLT